VKTVSTATLKTRLLYYLQAAVTEPVVIQTKDVPVAVLISFEEYERLASLEKNYWLHRAKKAEDSGYIGITKSAELLKAGLDEKP
jgi:prevent-host-death family protein